MPCPVAIKGTEVGDGHSPERGAGGEPGGVPQPLHLVGEGTVAVEIVGGAVPVGIEGVNHSIAVGVEELYHLAVRLREPHTPVPAFTVISAFALPLSARFFVVIERVSPASAAMDSEKLSFEAIVVVFADLGIGNK